MAQFTGISRKISKEGCIHIPKPIRSSLDIIPDVSYCSMTLLSNNSLLIKKCSKHQGLCTKVSSVGKIYIPSEIRSTMNICGETILNFSVKEDCILITNPQHVCIFCKSINESNKRFFGKYVCKHCIENLNLL